MERAAVESGAASWVEDELAACRLGDRRLVGRLGRLLHQLGDAMGEPLPLACQDWANTKAAYRFFANGRVNEAAILSGHFAATASRCATVAGPLLVVQDTTSLIYKWATPETVGGLVIGCNGCNREGRLLQYTQCGVLMHSSLVVTPEGVPLGLAEATFWTRSRFKGTNRSSGMSIRRACPSSAKRACDGWRVCGWPRTGSARQTG